MLLTAAVASPVAGTRPTTTAPGGEPPGDDSVLSLTPEQEASRLEMEALIQQVIANGAGGGDEIGPDYVCQFEPCEPSVKVLTVYPRQQKKSYYCGPAVVQVVSNFSWGKTGSNNKYSQQTISDNWTHTDQNGQTYLVDEIRGMNQASVRPPNFEYMQKHNPTYDNWHGTIIAGGYFWDLPLAAGVIPWKQGGTYHLKSWNIVSNGGHYLELHGYEGRVGSATRSVHFSDTAGTYADSVAANWEQDSYAVYQTMMYNNGNMIY
jgi:hypothetical protein